jgi:hypothetical protein
VTVPAGCPGAIAATGARRCRRTRTARRGLQVHACGDLTVRTQTQVYLRIRLAAGAVQAQMGNCASRPPSGGGATRGGGLDDFHVDPVPQSWRVERVRAKGVGSAFERLDVHRKWQPITDVEVINQLGRLCAGPDTGEVEYTDSRVTGNQFTRLYATQTPEGLIKERHREAEGDSMIRLLPYFFEFENGPRDWKPCTEPDACIALTAVLVSSATKTYKVTSPDAGEQSYEAQCIDERGLLLQRNINTRRLRRIRATPVGPDGQPHFEFADDSGLWQPVDPVCVKILANATTGAMGERTSHLMHTGSSSGHLLSKAHERCKIIRRALRNRPVDVPATTRR